MKKLQIDIGSTYFKINADGEIRQYFRNFDKDIYDDLSLKCGDIISKYKKEDIFIGLSTSGNSKNIINAVDIAEERGLKILLFLGKDGGKLADRGDLRFIIPEKTSDRIQEIHMMILHIIIEMVEREMFPENY